MISAPGHRSGSPHTCSSRATTTSTRMPCSACASSLIRRFERHEPGAAPDGRVLDVPFFTMDYDFVLAPEDA